MNDKKILELFPKKIIHGVLWRLTTLHFWYSPRKAYVVALELSNNHLWTFTRTYIKRMFIIEYRHDLNIIIRPNNTWFTSNHQRIDEIISFRVSHVIPIINIRRTADITFVQYVFNSNRLSHTEHLKYNLSFSSSFFRIKTEKNVKIVIFSKLTENILDSTIKTTSNNSNTSI